MRWLSCALVLELIALCLVATSYAAFWSAKKKKADTNSCIDGECGALTLTVFDNGESTGAVSVTLSARDCESSEDIAQTVCSLTDKDTPCQLYSAWGTRISSCVDVNSGDSVYVVPEHRLFVWPAKEIGYRIELKHLGLPADKPIVLETISERPRAFRLQNFFSESEAEQLVQNALAIEDDNFKLKRSTTGISEDGKQAVTNSKRTSEGAFDTNSEVAKAIKQRSFDILGISPYDEMWSDGLQILRYNQTAAYTPHMDWIEEKSDENHDWDSSGEGTNRFATVLLYLTDVELGGETVFPLVKPTSSSLATWGSEWAAAAAAGKSSSSSSSNGAGEAGVSVSVSGEASEEYREVHPASLTTRRDALKHAEAYLREQGLTKKFPPGSWERNMIAECKSRLSVRPKKAEAILFYSQFPDGVPDRLSLHGGCPVLQGQKWVANLWVWNGPRQGYMRKNPETGQLESPPQVSISASFESKDVTGAQLFWENSYWDELAPGRTIKVNTFAGHQWNVKLDGEVVVSWAIGEDKAKQRFVLEAKDLPSYS